MNNLGEFNENRETHAKIGRVFLSGLINQERESESNAISLTMECFYKGF